MSRLIKILNSIEEWTLVVILLALAFTAFVQVICRYILDFSFIWMEELNRYLGVFIAFLGAAIGVKYGTHFSMDLIYEKVESDRFRNALQVIVNLMCGLIFFVVAWYGWEQAMKLRKFGVMTSALLLPKYWAYLPVPFFSVIMGVRFLNIARMRLGRLIKGRPYVIGSEES